MSRVAGLWGQEERPVGGSSVGLRSPTAALAKSWWAARSSRLKLPLLLLGPSGAGGGGTSFHFCQQPPPFPSVCLRFLAPLSSVPPSGLSFLCAMD